MIDLFDYVQKSGLHLFIGAPKKEHPEIMFLSLSTDDYSEEEIFMARQPDETDAKFDKRVRTRIDALAAKIGSNTARHISNKYCSQKMAEIEKFFRGE